MCVLLGGGGGVSQDSFWELVFSLSHASSKDWTLVFTLAQRPSLLSRLVSLIVVTFRHTVRRYMLRGATTSERLLEMESYVLLIFCMCVCECADSREEARG